MRDKIRRLGVFCLVGSAVMVLTAGSFAQDGHLGIAMDGDPKYADDFSHFDYVNPQAPKGGMLRLSANGGFDTLNPFLVRGQPAAQLTLVYESLLARSYDEPFSLYGLIASRVDTNEDRSYVTFTLRPEVRWSDGVALTADDVLFSFETLRDHGRPNHRAYYKKVATAEKIDDLHVRFTFRPESEGRYDREMPLIMGLMPILPKHIFGQRIFDQPSLQTPVGSGPYVVETVDAPRSITYKRDPAYWGRDLAVVQGLYNFDRVRIDYYRDENVSLEAFAAGQYDLRLESDPNRWATSYDLPAVHEGRIILEQLPHHRPEPADGFVFNTRRGPFQDPIFRAALEYSFDSGWINRNLFHSQNKRIDSFFPNSELAAPSLPDDAETQVLDAYKDQLPASLFTAPVTPPSTDGNEDDLRRHLLQARALLQSGGYYWTGGRLYAPGQKEPVHFQILMNDFSRKKLALVWRNALERLGIDVDIRLVDSAEYEQRLAKFDFDVTIYKWISSLSPGNEQSLYWGSLAASQPGSRNYAGVRNPVIDALTQRLPTTRTRADLLAVTHALDRVLMAGHYTIPFFYTGVDSYAYWSGLRHPDVTPLVGTVRESWWSQKSP